MSAGEFEIEGWFPQHAVPHGVTLLAAGVISATAPEDSVALLALALALLGIGWNLGLVSGTTMITDAAPMRTRARTQGAVDLCVALAGAGGGLASGMVMAATSAATSYAALSIAGGVPALAVIPFVAASSRPNAAVSATGRDTTRSRG